MQNLSFKHIGSICNVIVVCFEGLKIMWAKFNLSLDDISVYFPNNNFTTLQ